PVPLHGSSVGQDASRKFGRYPVSLSSCTESKAAASRAPRSTTADHSQENSPPGLCRSSLPKVFHQSSYHPWVYSIYLKCLKTRFLGLASNDNRKSRVALAQ